MKREAKSASTSRGSRRSRGEMGRTSASVSGARCARTTAKAAILRTISVTIRRRSPRDRAGLKRHGVSMNQRSLLRSGVVERRRMRSSRERLFGMTPTAGANHGEDVKEYYFYLDSTPTHFVHEVPL